MAGGVVGLTCCDAASFSLSDVKPTARASPVKCSRDSCASAKLGMQLAGDVVSIEPAFEPTRAQVNSNQPPISPLVSIQAAYPLHDGYLC
jgi:hypothetical protein